MRRPRTLHGQFSFHGPFSCRLTARKSAAGDSFAGAVMMNVSWFPQAHKGTASFKNAHVGPLPLELVRKPRSEHRQVVDFQRCHCCQTGVFTRSLCGLDCAQGRVHRPHDASSAALALASLNRRA